MASRRMFSIRLINSARFLKMPISCQALYFHLGLHADDDGIVEAYNVIKTVGCTEDDLKVLVGKGFVQVLNEDLVSYITDWRENNKIRADRKIDSIYKDLLISLNPTIDLLEPQPRADRKDPTEESGTSHGQPMDGQWTDNGRHRLGKDRLVKDSIVKDSIGELKEGDKPPKRKRFTPPTLEEVKAYCIERKNTVDPQRFIDYYTSKGWLVGKNKMKDWKAAVRTWERNGYSSNKSNNTSKPTQAQELKNIEQNLLNNSIRQKVR